MIDNLIIKNNIIINGYLTSYSSIASSRNSSPTVLFLHGWSSSKEVWGSAMQSLATSGHNVVALDLPGFGGTDIPKEAWSVDNYVEFVKAFISKINLTQVIIVGHSFGGRISLVLTAKSPELVNKLVLVDSAGFHSSKRFKKFLAKISKAIRPFFRLRWLSPVRKKIYRAFGAEDYVATPELNKTFVKVIGEDLSKYLPLVTTPTLIIWGKNDLVTPIVFANQFSKHIKNSILQIIPGAGHYSFLDKPVEFNKILGVFVV
jgi:pimeloyl-ACP methyl ester carboxylesterase